MRITENSNEQICKE